MSESIEQLKALSDYHREQGVIRRSDNIVLYPAAQKLAAENGLVLIQCTESHYQLMPIHKPWVINLYPGNGRVYSDPSHKPRAPFLGLDPGWTLLHAVQELIDHPTAEYIETVREQ